MMPRARHPLPAAIAAPWPGHVLRAAVQAMAGRRQAWPWRLLLAAVCLAILAGCSSSPRKGGYYKDDGPGGNIPANVLSTPDAVPRIEPFAPANMRPYLVFGQRYVPISDNRGFRQEGIASWYGRKFHGQSTANGERYDMYAMTAAHPTLPLPSYARVTSKASGRSVIVRINDRGPFHSARIIDLSYAAAARLGLVGPGSGAVIVEAISHDQIRAGNIQRVAASPSIAPLPAAATTAVSGGRIFLQFGAFSAPDNAQGLAAELNRQLSGQGEAMSAQVRPANGLHRVLVGPYASRDEAASAAERIRLHTGLPSAVALH